MFCNYSNNQMLHSADGQESKLNKYAPGNINASREMYDCGDEITYALDLPTVIPMAKMITKQLKSYSA